VVWVDWRYRGGAGGLREKLGRLQGDCAPMSMTLKKQMFLRTPEEWRPATPALEGIFRSHFIAFPLVWLPCGAFGDSVLGGEGAAGTIGTVVGRESNCRENDISGLLRRLVISMATVSALDTMLGDEPLAEDWELNPYPAKDRTFLARHSGSAVGPRKRFILRFLCGRRPCWPPR